MAGAGQPTNTSKTRLGLTAMLAVVVLGGAACSRIEAVDETVEPSEADVEIDWERPRLSIEVAALQEARDLLPFAPRQPSVEGLERVFITDPAKVSPDERGVFLVFRDSDANPFWVVERLANPTWQDNYDQAVAECAERACTDTWSVTLIRGEIRALLIEGARPGRVTSLGWREGDIQYTVMGPAETFTREEAISLAESL